MRKVAREGRHDMIDEDVAFVLVPIKRDGASSLAGGQAEEWVSLDTTGADASCNYVHLNLKLLRSV